MIVTHVFTDAGSWKGGDLLPAIDASLTAEGCVGLSLPWRRFELKDDKQHLTRRGVVSFARALALAVHSACEGAVRVHIVSDSTLGDDPRALRIVKTALRRWRPCTVTLDAVCGSGYVACADSGDHFHARTSRWLRSERKRRDSVVLVLVGGWNDVLDARRRLAPAAARACAAMLARHASIKSRSNLP